MGGVSYGFSDDFEDGAINTSLWATGGAKRGPNPSYPIGVGNWQYSHQEIMDPIDGYMSVRVWGPTSGITYGADAWIRTVYNFNDGQSHVINFTWEADVNDTHHNHYLIQITDGYVHDRGWLHWPSEDYPGTANLLWGTSPSGDPYRGIYFASELGLGAGLPKSTWSITIDSSGIGRLYDDSDGMGSLIHEATLDPTYPWYIRLMVSDGTSAGFSAGDARLILYDFSDSVISEPTVQVSIDVKPGSCPNPLNVKDKGVLPVAVLGSEDFDVFKIDPVSIHLEGVAPIRSSYEDVATPASNEMDDCDCTTEGQDGYLDLILKFDVQEIVAALGGVYDGDELILTLTGQTHGGTPIEGTDCVVIIAKE